MTDLVPAVDRAMRILDAYKNGDSEFGVSELSRMLAVNKSTVHDIVQTLCEHRVLSRNETTRKYRLGAGLAELGDRARQQCDIRALARTHLNRLMEATGATVFLGVFENDGITIIEKAEAPSELAITAPLGQRVPYSGGSFGQAFLAFLDPAEVDRLLAEKGLRDFTPTSITDPGAFRERLQLVRERGYAVDDNQEYLDGVWAVSAPIHSGEGAVVAAVTVVAFTRRMTAEKKSAAIVATTRAASAISSQLGAPQTQVGA
ncbi:MAG: IclR family transcriptional regulator [Anaerolineales bacterium]